VVSLARPRMTDAKHESFDGLVFAMAGGTPVELAEVYRNPLEKPSIP
jgi:hypothetical protein